MNVDEFEKEMRIHHENGKILAKELGLSEQGFCLKKKNGRFTPQEIKKMADRYAWSAERICEIFALKGVK